MSQKLNTATAVLATALTLLHSCSAAASDNKITNIKVDGDTVYFSTSHAKSHTLPNCVTSTNNQQWTLSLTSAAGKASYTLLVAAMTDNRSISVTSANDCADSTGYERAQSIEVGDTIANTTNGSSGHFSLYKGDGVTKIGTILNFDKGGSEYQVLRQNGDNKLDFLVPDNDTRHLDLYFSDENCTQVIGSFYPTSGRFLYYNGFYKNSQFFSALNPPTTKYVGYVGSENGQCLPYKTNRSVYPMVPSVNTHPLCGKGMCQIKAD
ncbi:hypothetical protein [Pseudoalteromonas aurantia]|uniref:Uncharacterized protein n=1 Tax=Pseudoalteromonas aurantia 208 TaxID=1314867 RepID=A0ABR9EAV2_9GAMM|nr:hypothetical protein [Pseudoalteromonas aurantia]MBE0368094.1 hypothetical protein [Pseudoalteromonas aurantia 208]